MLIALVGLFLVSCTPGQKITEEKNENEVRDVDAMEVTSEDKMDTEEVVKMTEEDLETEDENLDEVVTDLDNELEGLDVDKDFNDFNDEELGL